ncbi:YdiY family protein [Parvularcula sp. IMCC14364]|uniref:DUF481 domain-containing protein n=1 Tax=Parvularcula sp. IMCC14364 TaxID=3067902 RepID=UPI0027405C76|nr:DUF481 domain-containing protein [Parvularcula sp. IMCC14364]
MMKTILGTSLTIVWLSAVPAVCAQETGSEWEGSVEFSAANATGNSETTNLGLGLVAKRKVGRFLNTITSAANFAESESLETQNNWLVAYQVDFDLDDRTYAYGRAQYEEDQFSGFDNRLFLGAGLGRFLIEQEGKVWKVEGGPGYRLSTIETPAPPVPAGFDEEESEFALYASSDFDMTIREGVDLTHDLASTYTQSNTTVTTTVGLVTQLTNALSSKLSYQVDYETDPPVGREDTDTLLKASVLFTY